MALGSFRFEIEERIEAPVDKVFDRLTDLDHYADWVQGGGVFEGTRQISPGPVAVGTQYIDRVRLVRLQGEVAELERPSRLAFRQWLRWLDLTLIDGRISYELRPDGTGTFVRQVAEMRLRGALGLLTPLIRWRGPRERRRVLAGLKRSLEAQGMTCPWPSSAEGEPSSRAA